MSLDHRYRVAVICSERPLRDASGAFEVFRLEIETIRRMAAEPVLVTSAPSLSGVASVARRAEIARAAERLGAPIAALIGARYTLQTLPALFRTANRVLRREPFGPEADIDLCSISAPAPRGNLGLPLADAVICNNLSCLSIADRLAPPERQLLILHELPAAEMSKRLIRAIGSRPHVLALSHGEAERLRRTVPVSQVHVGLPVADGALSGVAQPRLAGHLGDTFTAAGPSRVPPGGWSAGIWGERQNLDLLFVGGRHPPNVEGMRAFLAECFLPHLVPRGISLAIAGASGDLLAEAHGHPNIAILGHVADLGPLYAATKVVVVPLLNGTGVSIKTVEAASFGKPIVATTAGVRGLGPVSEMALPLPFDERWTRTILDLLANPSYRHVWQQDLAKAIAGPTLGATMRHVISTFANGGDPRPLPSHPLLAIAETRNANG